MVVGNTESSSILLSNGIVLTHGPDDHVIPQRADLLIKNNIIATIAPNIKASEGTTVIDCTNKILSPGFIDTHHHVWQTLLKGRCGNDLLFDYMLQGNLQSSNHTPADVYWGQLGGCLECLDAGTTTVVDHAHMNYSPEHTHAAIAATVSSGIRSIFGYCPTLRLDSWNPFSMSQNILPDWVMNTLVELAKNAPFGDGRVSLGFAFDGLFLPKEIVVDLFNKVKSLGIKLITIHYAPNAVFGFDSPVVKLESYGLLDSLVLFSHALQITQEDAALIQKSNSHISSTPSTELQMAMGYPIAFSETLHVQSHSSLGIDCHVSTTASIPNEMRLLLQSSRALHSQKFLDIKKVPKKTNKTVEEAFNLGTIGGARAVRMEDQIGSLAVGKRADIVVFDAMSTSMIAAAQQDPVTAIVLHSSPRDVVLTIVDGVIRKYDQKLMSVRVTEGESEWAGGVKDLDWADVAKELLSRREVMAKKIAALDLKEAGEGLMKAMYIGPGAFADTV